MTDVTVGDFVEFTHVSGKKTGRVVSVENEHSRINVDIYCTDSIGGYKVTVPLFNVLRLVKENSEEIKKPMRYNKRGKLECWDVILDQEMGFLEGNIIKYLWRHKEKGGVEDLKKARVYLDKLISEVEK
jgi:hypothetical protein